MLKIQRSANEEVVFALSGSIETEDYGELDRLFNLETRDRAIALDLTDITFADREAIGFLANCEAKGIRLANCPGYIRGWIDTEQSRISGERLECEDGRA